MKHAVGVVSWPGSLASGVVAVVMVLHAGFGGREPPWWWPLLLALAALTVALGVVAHRWAPMETEPPPPYRGNDPIRVAAEFERWPW